MLRVVVVLLALTSTASADSYRSQVLTADAIATTTFVGGLRLEDDRLVIGGVGMYAFGAPLVHLANRQVLRGMASLALRIALPPLAEKHLGEGQRCTNCIDDPLFPNRTGLFLGFVAAMVIDSALIARPVEKPVRGWAPTAGATRDGFTVGATGRF
jgi:hypothetical protein